MPKAKKSDLSHINPEVNPVSLSEGEIVFQGIKTHNLKDIDLTLPKNKLITIT